MDISLHPFLRFISASGRSKVARVEETKGDWEARTDFYKQLRERATYSFRHHDFGERLQNLPNVVNDGRNHKQANYRECIDSLNEWVGSHDFNWISAPTPQLWTYDELNVRVNPELFMDIDGEKYIVKLFWSKEPLKRHALDAFGYLVETTLGSVVHAKPAILEVRRSRLRIPPVPTQSIERMVKGEAAHFIALWNMPNVA